MAPDEEPIVVDDLAVLRALFDESRLRVLAAFSEARSISEVAKELDVPVTRLYHHVGVLSRHGLLRESGQRKTGRHSETTHVAVQQHVRLSPRLQATRLGRLFETHAQDADPPSPIFGLTEYDIAGKQLVTDCIDLLMRSQSGLLADMPTERVDSVPESRITLASGEVVASTPVASQMDIYMNIPEVIEGDLQDFISMLDGAAEQSLSQIMPEFFKYLSDVCDASGQTVNAGGRPISHALLLEAIAAVEISFDENGEPEMPTLVLHPKTAETIASLPPPTPEEDAAFESMMKRKKEEWFAKRRTRKLH